MPYYGVYVDPRSFMHYGIKKRSGRYPYGSGERPYQDRFSYRVGEKRLKKRRKVLSEENDLYATKAGLNNNFKSINVETLNKQTKDILDEPERVAKIGKGTIQRRAAAWTAGGLGAAGLTAIGAMALDTITLGAAAGLVPIGLAYLYHRKTTY